VFQTARLVTPECSLCSDHALAVSGTDGDWIPLIRKNKIPGRTARPGPGQAG
jgi:hypothetical protein